MESEQQTALAKESLQNVAADDNKAGTRQGKADDGNDMPCADLSQSTDDDLDLTVENDPSVEDKTRNTSDNPTACNLEVCSEEKKEGTDLENDSETNKIKAIKDVKTEPDHTIKQSDGSTAQQHDSDVKEENELPRSEEDMEVCDKDTNRSSQASNQETEIKPDTHAESTGDKNDCEMGDGGDENGPMDQREGDAEESCQSQSESMSTEASGTDLCTPREAGFTSENFKIEVSKLPRKFGFAQMRKRLAVTLGLNPHKIKALPNKCFAFVCFSCEEDREKALTAINGHVWKNQTLCAKKALPAADPMKRKRQDGEEESSNSKRMKQVDDRPPTIRLRSAVEPLWEVPYQEQLQRKTDKAEEALRMVAKNGEVWHLFIEARKENKGMCCPLEPIVPSPVLEGYRNKAEFSVGRAEDGKETVVGFRFGLYKDGTDRVGSPSEISIISSDSKKVVECFEKFVRVSQFAVFDHRTHHGHWRHLTVRTSRAGGGILAVVEFVVNNVSQEQLAAEKESLHKYFTEGEGKAANVSTFFFRPCSARTSNSITDEPYQLMYGEGHIYETMLGLKFRISPSSFFQVNTAAAEVLYKQIADWCNASPTTTILDICCGTGTIGQSMAKSVKKVIGVEMCKEAIEDAKVNAQLNGMDNVEYQCAKVETVIQDIMRYISDDCVAVLDPPRGGLNTNVIRALRTCTRLQKIVFAACNPAGVKQNFVDLCRPATRKMRGEPFRIVRAMPFDMFPSTLHFELLIMFERDPPQPYKSELD